MANGNGGLVWKIIGPIIAGALLTFIGYSYASLEKRVEELRGLVYELNGLIRSHIGIYK